MGLPKPPFVSGHFQTFGHLSSAEKHPTLTIPMNAGPVLVMRKERRAAARYKLRLPVIFHWNDGAEHTEGGFTSDVAIDGALIISSKCPPIGAKIRVQILLPSPDQSGEELRIECLGTVTRVVEQAGSGAFGVRGIFDDDHLTRHVLM